MLVEALDAVSSLYKTSKNKGGGLLSKPHRPFKIRCLSRFQSFSFEAARLS